MRIDVSTCAALTAHVSHSQMQTIAVSADAKSIPAEPLDSQVDAEQKPTLVSRDSTPDPGPSLLPPFSVAAPHFHSALPPPPSTASSNGWHATAATPITATAATPVTAAITQLPSPQAPLPSMPPIPHSPPPLLPPPPSLPPLSTPPARLHRLHCLRCRLYHSHRRRH